MEDEVHIVDWQKCQQNMSPYRGLEAYLEANTKPRYDQHGIIGDDQLNAKMSIASTVCLEKASKAGQSGCVLTA